MLIRRMVPFFFIATAALAASGDTRLPDAAMQGDREAVRFLLRQKADVNAVQGDGTTALHWAAYKDDLAMAQMLITAGANVKAATRIGALTPLYMASQSGDAALVQALLKAGADPKAATTTGTTPLMMAAASGSAEAVKILLDHGADVNAKDTLHAQTALMFAAARNRDAAIKVLITHGADTKASTNLNRFQRVRLDANGEPIEETPKPSAAAISAGGGGRAGGVGGLGEDRVAGATVIGGLTALLFAARDGQMNATSSLVEAGADVNQVASGDNTSPIVMAIINGHYDIAKYLLDHGADPNVASAAGLAALYATINVQWAPHAFYPQPNPAQEKITYLELMKALLDRGADPNARLRTKLWFSGFTHDQSWVDAAGTTPFWRAAQSSDVAAMKLLVAAGADPAIPSIQGDTALIVAAGLGWDGNFTVNAPDSWMTAVKYCLELGLDLNTVDSKGYTALHGAAFRGDNEMISFLAARGARTGVVTKAGDTVADMANGPDEHSTVHLDTVALLESMGAKNSNHCRSNQCVVAPNANARRPGPPPNPAAPKDK